MLDRELQVLHVAKSVFEQVGKPLELITCRGEQRIVCHLDYRLGSANAGDDILALRVYQVLTE
jgi:hypothetical protein